MKTIRYTKYMLDRMEFRRIPRSVVEGILQTAVERYFDIETGRCMAVQRVKYQATTNTSWWRTKKQGWRQPQ